MDYRRLLDPQHRGIGLSLTRLALRAAALPYRIAVTVRNARYDRGRLEQSPAGVPVISIGNITAGGTGKTPMVAAVAEHLRQRGLRVALISRGYGSSADSSGNDEARELYERLPDVPHLQNPDRVAAAQTAVDELEMQALVLDDGFQHRRLARDLDVVMIDATCPFGYGRLLPAGLLREPASQLRRADFAMISRADRVTPDAVNAIEAEIHRLAPDLPTGCCTHAPACWINSAGQRLPLESLSDRPAIAFAGIGNPQPFFDTLQEIGLQLVDRKSLPDHCEYDRDRVSKLDAWIRELSPQTSDPGAPAPVAICTHKDLVKLRTARLGGIQLVALQVDLQITKNAELFWAMIDKVTASISSETDAITTPAVHDA